MSQLTVQDVEQMQQGSSLLSELYAEKAELEAEFVNQLADIEERIHEAGGPAPGRQSAPAAARGGRSTSRRTASSSSSDSDDLAPRTPRARNPHSLEWYILVVMQEAGGHDVSEAHLVEKILEMGYQTNATDFHNSVYTTLYTMQRKKFVKKSEEERHWKLMSKGSKEGEKAYAEYEEEQEQE